MILYITERESLQKVNNYAFNYESTLKNILPITIQPKSHTRLRKLWHIGRILRMVVAEVIY
jgi:hypothetical protein